MLSLLYQPTVQLVDAALTVVSCEQLSGAPRAYDLTYDLAAIKVGCHRAAAWAWPYPARLSVNIRPSYLHVPGFAGDILAQIYQAGLSPNRVILEIVEEPLELTPLVLHALRTLHDAGVILALDDVGSGYFSDPRVVLDLLTQLRQAGIDVSVIKLDKSLALHSTARPFIKAARDTQVTKIVVEGIQDPPLMKHLLGLGFAVQGFAFQRPLAPLALELFVARHYRDQHIRTSA